MKKKEIKERGREKRRDREISRVRGMEEEKRREGRREERRQKEIYRA